MRDVTSNLERSGCDYKLANAIWQQFTKVVYNFDTTDEGVERKRAPPTDRWQA